MALSVTGVQAWPTPGLVGWGVGWGSIDVDSLWKKVGNLEKEPVDIKANILITEVLWKCCNHGGQCGGLGNPFDLSVLTETFDTLDVSDLVGKGKAAATNTVSDEDIRDAVLPVLYDVLGDDVCQNPNWSVDYIEVTKLEIELSAQYYYKDHETLVWTDPVCGLCERFVGEDTFTCFEVECL